MSQNKQINQSYEKYSALSHQNQVDDEINLIDLIYPIYKRRKFLFFFCLIISIFVLLVTYKSKKIYEATVVILPESKESDGGVGGELKAAFLSQFGIAGIGVSQATPSEVFEAVLKSKN